MVKVIKKDIVPEYETVDIGDTMVRSYIEYSLANVIRVIPSTVDGLIPSHRRILTALNAFGRRGNKYKSARIVGEVLGKYHPHGDQSVYDAMQGMAVEFKKNHPLIETQGNWGSLDGDPQAAMRYTECCISKFAEDMYFGLEYDYNDFVSNYDNTEKEPAYISPKIPCVLVNGAQGTMPGWVSSIPQHDLAEICDYTISFIKGKDNLNLISGPKFPLPGKIISANIMKGLETGKCAFKIAAPWHVEHESYGRFNLIFTSIPFGTNKERVLNKLLDYYKRDKDKPNSFASFIANIKDESTTDVRICILLKKVCSEAQAKEMGQFLIDNDIMSLSDYYSMNMNVKTDDGRLSTPICMGVREIVAHWYKHRVIILNRYFDDILKKNESKLAILQDVVKFISNYKTLSLAIIDNDTDGIYKIFAKHKIAKESVDYILNSTYNRFKNKSEEIVNDIKKTENEITKFKNNKKDINEYMISEIKQIKKVYG